MALKTRPGRHWPVAIEEEDLKPFGGLRLAGGTPNPKLHIEFEYLDTWREMVSFKKQGKVKHLGVCNFTVEQLKALIAAFPDDIPEVYISCIRCTRHKPSRRLPLADALTPPCLTLPYSPLPYSALRSRSFTAACCFPLSLRPARLSCFVPTNTWRNACRPLDRAAPPRRGR